MRDHRRVRRLGVAEEDIFNGGEGGAGSEGLQAREDALLRVFVNGDGGEVRLADADDRGHDEHALHVRRGLAAFDRG